MTGFANKEASKARSLARQRQEADADGFITVTRGGRTNPARQEMAQEQAEKRKEKQKGLEDFYKFQSREKRKQRAGELVKKFEEDKEKVRKMRERRGKFRVGPRVRCPACMLMMMLVCSPNKARPSHPIRKTAIVSFYETSGLAQKWNTANHTSWNCRTWHASTW